MIDSADYPVEPDNDKKTVIAILNAEDLRVKPEDDKEIVIEKETVIAMLKCNVIPVQRHGNP